MTEQSLKRILPLTAIFICFATFFIFNLDHYLTFTSLKQHRQSLLSWTEAHYFLAVLIYITIYSLTVATSIPGATFLTLIGGFLFGILYGTAYVVISATLGSTFLFIAIKIAFEPKISSSTNRWMQLMRHGFQKNAFSYLLTLRLIPLFPFWAVNIVPALLGVNIQTFIAATGIGIIPGSLIYTSIGNGLGQLLDQNKTPDLNVIFEPIILLPLIGLGLLSLMPTIYQWIKRKNP